MQVGRLLVIRTIVLVFGLLSAAILPAEVALPAAPVGIDPMRADRALPNDRTGAFIGVEQASRSAVGSTLFPPQARPLPGDHDLDADADVPVYGYRVVNEYPHDRFASTQGLVYVDGVLYEGTGQMGRSTLRRVELETGEVLQSVSLHRDHFGEGIAAVGDRIYQLTWQTRTCFVYDRETFDVLEMFTYQGEGWGLTTDGTRLIMSDGTSRLAFRDPETFAITGHVEVREGNKLVENLNELEYVDGEVWANVWKSDRIARIDPATGHVTGWIDLSGLLSEADREEQPVDVLNGIAYDPTTGRIFVTGKLWPTLFEIELVPPA